MAESAHLSEELDSLGKSIPSLKDIADAKVRELADAVRNKKEQDLGTEARRKALGATEEVHGKSDSAGSTGDDDNDDDLVTNELAVGLQAEALDRFGLTPAFDNENNLGALDRIAVAALDFPVEHAAAKEALEAFLDSRDAIDAGAWRSLQVQRELQRRGQFVGGPGTDR